MSNLVIMSRVGTKPITIEDGVKVEIQKSTAKVTGPLGELSIKIPVTLKVSVDEKEVLVERVNESKQARSDHGTIRSIIANMIQGVKEGFKKELELVGMGYRAQMEGKALSMSLGWNHPVKVEPPEGLTFAVRDNVFIEISGIDKELVGLWAARIRSIRKPEPYKGKGIRYVGEVVRRKTSKTIKEE